MNRADIVQIFRTENPEITSRVITDSLLYDWCKQGDKEICAITRCIVGDTTFTCAEDDEYWDLTVKIPKFYDIDEYPGGGVSYDDDRLTLTTIAELDNKSSGWRTRSSGEPKNYFRRGKHIYTDRPCLEAKSIHIYTILISDDFDSDTDKPYNNLTYLEPFHYGINKYLQWKAKEKIGKQSEASTAKNEFFDFTKWMKSMLGGNKFSPITYEKMV